MSEVLDLSVIIPVLGEGSNLETLLPEIRKTLSSLGIRSEILVVAMKAGSQTVKAAARVGAQIVEPRESGYCQALTAGFTRARGEYSLSMDDDVSHRPAFIGDLWANRLTGEIIIASRYVPGGRADMPAARYLLSRVLNIFFSRGLGMPIRDLSSGFRLYKSAVVHGRSFLGRDLDILQEILVRAYADGWRVREIPFTYAPRRRWGWHARVFRFGLAYLKTFWSLWKLRNSILAADYDSRAYDSSILLQRFWQRSRYRHIVELITGEGPVLDVGCGSSRIMEALRPDSVALDISLPKLRYARRYSRTLVQGSGTDLPFGAETFPCVVCSQVIEHLPREAPILVELERVLAPGGRLILGTPDYGRWEWLVMEKLYGLFARGGYADEHITHFNRRGLIKRLEERGFSLEETRYILRGELILAFRKAGNN
jgi:dolichol-phosphate mannosyltransferase